MRSDHSPHIFATLHLRGRGLKPNDVSEYLGINPSKSFVKGEMRGDGEMWNHNYWSLTSQEFVISEDVSDHINWLLNQLAPVKAKVIEILSKKGIQAEISCFWIFPSSHGYFSLQPDQLKSVSDLGIEISFDFYCPHV